MFNALKNGLTQLINRPLLVLLSMFFFLLQYIIIYFSFDWVFDLIFFFMYPSAEISLESIPFFLLMNYPLQLFVLLVHIIISLFLFNWLYNSMAIAVIKDMPSAKAIIESASNWKKHIGLSIFYVSAAIIYFAVLALILWIATAIDLGIFFALFIILFLLLGLIGILVVYKFIFIPVALAVESNAKKAIQISWHFTSMEFFTGFALFVIAFLFNYLVGAFGSIISDLIQDEIISAIIFVVFIAIGITFALLCMIAFFKEKSRKK